MLKVQLITLNCLDDYTQLMQVIARYFGHDWFDQFNEMTSLQTLYYRLKLSAQDLES